MNSIKEVSFINNEDLIMSAVLIDNWNLVNADIIKNSEGKDIPNNAYSDVLSALVLWDEVYYLDEGLSTFGWIYSKKGEPIKKILKPLFIDLDIRETFEKSADLLYSSYYEEEYTKIVAKRAIYYSEISKAFQIDYFPVCQRADFLSRTMNITDLWTRNEIIKEEEREILSRIKRFNDSNSSNIVFPLLTNLIIKNSNNSGKYFETALSIKNTKEVKNFRKYMDKIDQEINRGNVSELRYALSLIPEIVNDIQNMDKKIELTASVKMKISPSVISMMTGTILSGIYSENKLLSMGLFCGTLGTLFKESNIEIKKEWNKTYYPKKIQTTFLRNLAKGILL